MHRRIISLMVFFLFLVPVISGCAKNIPPKKPLAQNQAKLQIATLLKAATGDPYNNGCVSCHKKTGDVDKSLPAYVKRIPGHPEVKEATLSACYNCHEAQKNYDLYKKFLRRIHQSHWQSDTFYVIKGTCYSCHTVESNGVSGLKDYPLAGYRTGIGASKSVQPKVEQAPKSITTPKPTPTPTSIAVPENKQELPKTEQPKKQEQGLVFPKTRLDQIPVPTP